jgi:hypothetical protein
MFKKNRPENEKLDRLGKVILRSAAAREEDVETAASAPFLFARVRAAIAEQRQTEESGSWFSLVLVARRAIPAMALVALFAALLTVWSARPGSGLNPNTAEEEGLFELVEPGVERTVLAGRNGLSRDEVFNIVVERNYEVKAK